MRTHVLFSLLALSTLATAQFTSGFETWNDTLPEGWGGQKTNIGLINIEQVDNNSHSGGFAVRLINDTVTNKRLATQPLQLDSGTTYLYNFWVRGHGEVHVSMFDERGAPGGIATYSTYVVIADDVVWQPITASILCTHSSAIGEFIIGVRNTAGPEHLVIDDVNITDGSSDIVGTDAFDALNVFPNPATDVLNIALGRVAGRTDYELTDALGRITSSGIILSDRARIDTRSYAPGIYTLGLRGTKGSKYLQVLVK
ncbi:MAG: T9SS type A sorting domain-containing protein [Flavobacteriales bacterium]|nr:T9SS type A sorting domain-containing protein [Flavobacteriales bacterium]